MRRGLLAIAVLLSPLASFAQAPSDSTTPGWAPFLLVRALPTRPDGMRSAVSNEKRLSKESPMEQTLWTSRGLCAMGGGNPEAFPQNGPPVNIWRMTAEYLGQQAERYQVRITSGFSRIAGRDTSSTTTQTFSLQEGDTVVLDAVSAPPDSSCDVHTMIFEARLVLRPADRSLERARYSADLWLVHTDPTGQERRQHMMLSADGTHAVPFAFGRLAFPIPQVDPRQTTMEAVIRLTGTMRLRPRADGQIDVDLSTNAFLFGLERPENPRPDVPLATVRKTVTLKEDETTAIEFPAKGVANLAVFDGRSQTASETGGGGGRGASATRLGPGGATAATDANWVIEARNNRINLNLAPFFKDHRTQLLVTLKRMR
jgi:hypothetical protein